MITLDALELANTRSFVKKARIVFPRKGLLLLRGKNLDTGGSSGSGKSTIAMAINHAYGACDIPATELRSWGSKAPPDVQLELGGAKNLVLNRFRTFDLSIDGKAEPGSIL